VQKNFLVSVIIPNWNGRRFLGACLDSIFEQTCKNFEVIVIDCASSDGSADFIRDNYPWVTLLQLAEDHGPPQAINLAANKAKGNLVLIINNDITLPLDTLQTLVDELRGEHTVLCPTELTMEGKYSHAGVTTAIGELLYRLFKALGISRAPGMRTFYPSTACCLTTRRLILDNPLNENFFMYEDIEWGWRLNLTGARVEVSPNCFFRHKGSGTKPPFSPQQSFLQARSWIASCYIGFRRPTFFLLLPLILGYFFLTLTRYVLKGKYRSFLWHIKGFFDFFKKIRLFDKDRNVAQQRRALGDLEMIKLMIDAGYLNERIKAEVTERDIS
jgi:GT2 family glycosyltransferase